LQRSKKKKIFSTLAICSLIFNSIKKIEKFKDSNTIDIEGPIKVFIAGAKFRLKTPNNDNEKNINNTI
ncbi:kinesin-related protein 2-like, partial [Aphis craccivora]